MRRELKVYPTIKRNIILIHGIRTHNRVFEEMRDRLITDSEIGQEWVQFFTYYLAGMGRSGKYGFHEVAQGRVRNIVRKDWKHNEFLKGYEDFKNIILERYDRIPLND